MLLLFLCNLQESTCLQKVRDICVLCENRRTVSWFPYCFMSQDAAVAESFSRIYLKHCIGAKSVRSRQEEQAPASVSRQSFFFFCLIEFNSIQCRCQWEVCVADATATHSLSNLALLMMFSSSQTITRETPTDKGNMSSFSCQEGLWALDVQTPSTASKMDDLKTGAELWDFVV